MLIDKQITNKINDRKQKAMQEAQNLIDSSSGQTNTIPVSEVRNMRMAILKDFRALSLNLPLIIQEDIQTGLSGDMNGLISRLRNLNKELTDAKSEEEIITGCWQELNEKIKKIRTGK